LVEAIQKAHGAAVQTNLVTGSGGIFDVAIDGELVFRKFDANRFPENREILAEIGTRLKKA
jgi:selT/selW/selH-like putative selenoprotein